MKKVIWTQKNSTKVIHTASNILTQNVFGSQLQQILELEIDVNNSHAPSDGQNKKVIAVDVLEKKKTHPVINIWTARTLISREVEGFTSCALGQSLQLHTWLLAVKLLFMEKRHTVTARVPTITSHGCEATSRPWSLNRRASMISGVQGPS